MTEEDLVAIEQLMKQRPHVFLSNEEWSRSMANAMLDKIPDLIQAVRNLQKDHERNVDLIKKKIEWKREAAKNLGLWLKREPQYSEAEELEKLLGQMEQLSVECRV